MRADSNSPSNTSSSGGPEKNGEKQVGTSSPLPTPEERKHVFLEFLLFKRMLNTIELPENQRRYVEDKVQKLLQLSGFPGPGKDLTQTYRANDRIFHGSSRKQKIKWMNSISEKRMYELERITGIAVQHTIGWSDNEIELLKYYGLITSDEQLALESRLFFQRENARKSAHFNDFISHVEELDRLARKDDHGSRADQIRNHAFKLIDESGLVVPPSAYDPHDETYSKEIEQAKEKLKHLTPEEQAALRKSIPQDRLDQIALMATVLEARDADSQDVALPFPRMPPRAWQIDYLVKYRVITRDEYLALRVLYG